MSMQLHTYVEARLNRWSIWFHSGSRPGPRKVISWWGPMVLDRNVAQHRTSVIVDPTEAQETDRAVHALAAELRAAVIEVYTRGGTMEQKARALRCCRDTVYVRLQRANVKLLGYFNDQAAGVQLPVRDELQKDLTSSYKIPNIAATVG